MFSGKRSQVWHQRLHLDTRRWTRTHWMIALGVALLLWFFFGWVFGLVFSAIAGLASFLGWLAGIILAAALVAVAFLLIVAFGTKLIADRLD